LTGWLLPIWIGLFEAHAIAMKMEKITPQRPMTHDLLNNLLNATQCMMERVEVTDLVDNTYLAKIFFYLNDQEHSIDSRPSDAIALALRGEVGIYVANHVLDSSKIDPAQMEEGQPEKSEGEWEDILRGTQGESSKTKLN
ncbi:MAG: bifunctional nuclease family protein, partial [Deltaproteobacteria bacterium]|nr:bifunctional nuclease family protein [Deltaproteobacteria bacterium]